RKSVIDRIYPEDSRTYSRSVAAEGAGVFAVWVKNNEPRVDSCPATFLPRCFEGPADEPGHGARLPAPGIAEHGEVPPEQTVRIDEDSGARRERARTDLNALPLSGLND